MAKRTIETERIALEVIAKVAEALTAQGWPCTFEYPGYIEACGQEGLSIAIGPATDGTPNKWTADYMRDDVHVGSWSITVLPKSTPEGIAGALGYMLMTQTVEE